MKKPTKFPAYLLDRYIRKQIKLVLNYSATATKKSLIQF